MKIKTHVAFTALALISGLGISGIFGQSVAGQMIPEHTESPWTAHINVGKLRNSPLAEILGNTLDLKGVLRMQHTFEENLNLNAESIDTATLFGAGKKWQDNAIILHGKFDTLDLSPFLTAKGAREIHQIRIFERTLTDEPPLFFSRHSPAELVAGTSLEAVEDSLAVLDEKRKKWDETALPDHAVAELSTAIVSLSLDMRRIGSGLHFEADFTRSIQRVWLLAGTRSEDVELTLLIESNNAADFEFLNKQLTLLTAMVTSLEDPPPDWLKLIQALKVETHDRWMTVKVSAPPAQATRFLQSMAPLFKEEAKPAIRSPEPDSSD